ncbi:MAG: 50S ribosomal protein L29 [Desulfobacteraceae bacterium]|nr:MAG: 50S ribosomal protein L29 [Desulfobacteraceae bacterium]
MKPDDVRALSQDELNRKMVDLKHELFNLRFQKSIGQLENPRKLKQTQKDIARVHTVLTEMARNTKETDK